MFNALSAYAGFDELESGTGVPRTTRSSISRRSLRSCIRPDNETFRINVLSTYNVIDAAVKLGIRKVIFASSETTYGICFADGEVKPEYVPIDEEHPTVPHDSYAMSKVVNEATARSFQARTGIDIYGLRINNVIEPHEYEIQVSRVRRRPGLRRRNIFAYIDARDLGHMVDAACGPTASATRCSTSRTTTRRSGSPATRCTNGSTPGCHAGATWVATRRSTPTTRPSGSSGSHLATRGETSSLETGVTLLQVPAAGPTPAGRVTG